MSAASTTRRACVALIPLVLTLFLAACAAGGGTGQTETTPTHAAVESTAPSGTAATSSGSTAPSETSLSGTQTTGTTYAAASAGSLGGGDPYFASAGNGGYDVLGYDITLDVEPDTGRVTARAVVRATALQSLSMFSLDLVGLDVSSVLVNGTAASFRRDGQELKITCPQVVEGDKQFSVEVSYSGVPKGIKNGRGWHRVDGTIYTFDEPQGAACWFPVNDTPADKATYILRISVPKPYMAVATGVLTSTESHGNLQTFVWEMKDPMASYLAGVDIGDLVEETSTSKKGVAIRNYFDPKVADQARRAFARQGEVVDYFGTLFGPYPFQVCGIVALNVDIEAAMENQTLILFGRNKLDSGVGFLAHELAHQWLGNSVTINRWKDIWLNEGFATYASWLWYEHTDGWQGLQAEIDRSQRELKASVGQILSDPGAGDLFHDFVYLRGALTLHALRLEVGDDSFFRIMRAWAERHKFGNADTSDFIALAKEMAPQVPEADLDSLFDRWLNQPELPSLPASRAH